MSVHDPAILARQIGHRFRQPGLLDEALTHRSAGSDHNERLEFLGDAVLNLVIAAALFARRPQAPEGDLSRLRAALVRERTLAEIAQELQLGDFVALGAGELRSGGFRRASILADTLEAVIGSVYLDGGFAAAETTIHALFAGRLQNLPAADALKDPKTRLQETLQGQGRPLPAYEIIEISGEAHAQRFVARCRLSDCELATEGSGHGRRRAEQAAAQRMLEALVDE